MNEPAVKTPGQIMDEARAFVDVNLPKLCQEILDWHNTGFLCSGKTREVAAIIARFEPTHDLAIAENLVNGAALLFVVQA